MYVLLTKYLSVATDTKMTSSPTLTFSPSDLCLEAGWTVHQQASPEDKQHREGHQTESLMFALVFGKYCGQTQVESDK